MARAATHVLATLLILLPAAALASDDDKPRVTNVEVTLEGRRVYVAFQLENVFDAELAERIDSGLPTVLVYEIALYKDFKKWWDRRFDGTLYQISVTYDAVTREYLINFKRQGKLVETRIARNHEDLERAMTRVDGVEAFSLPAAVGDRRLLVRVRAELGSRTLLKLIPTKIQTDWAESKKFRPPEDTP